MTNHHSHPAPEKKCCHSSNAKPQAAAIEGALYTCPMHPEIVQDRPGSCPICGMALEPMGVNLTDEPDPELIDMSRRFWASLVLVIPILLLTMGMHVPGLVTLIARVPEHVSAWLQFIFATPVVLWCGWPFLERAWLSLESRNLNMFTLIALGTSVAYIYSVNALLFPHLFPPAFRSSSGGVNLYFEAAAVITMLVLMGQVLEIRSRQRTSHALRALLDLAPKTAMKVNADGTETEVTLDHVHVEDLLRVKPGEHVPVDGEVVEGHSTVDEAMVTGESIPVEKQAGLMVIGGTLNLTGSFIMRAKRVGKETMLAQIVQQVAEAQRSRAPIQRLADQIAAYFVPAVIGVAAVTFIVWAWIGPSPAMAYGLFAAISVLIIACPCALGLATPMSIIVGMGKGAQSGILIKNAESLERFEKVNLLIVDKTGTLTLGKPVVEQIISAGTVSEADILRLSASLERNSEHPLADAIVAAAQQRGLTLVNPTEFHAEFGKGIIGKIEGRQIALGNDKLLQLLNVTSDALAERASTLRENGATVMFVVIDGSVAGLISVADPIKTSTEAALRALRAKSIRIVMVTGDNRTTTTAIAKKLGITEVEAEVLPQQKQEIVSKYKAQGNIVAMAGDGVNDAAALAAADVGIAMGTGTDIAIQSASITLVKGDLNGIVRALSLSKQVMRNIRQNLFLAFIYNILCIPIAAGVLYPWTGILLNPMFAALAMSLSSVSVILNALRLR